MSKRSTLWAALALAAVAAALFGDILFRADPPMLSEGNADLARQYIHWRRFGFGELRRGNLALWTPNLFAGMPFFGGFQSALLYPPNFVYLFLPLPLAVNWGLALHAFLAGFFTLLWAAERGLRPLACLLSAVLLMCCGAHWMHLYAGHLSNLCTMTWAPLLFLAVDGWLRRRTLAWCLLGMLAVAMQIFAGHPQYFFNTTLAAGIYCLLRLLRAAHRFRAAAGLLAMLGGGLALSAVQLLPGLEASDESVRNVGLSFDVAAMFSFPPENFLTLLAPGFFGDEASVPYWGRCYLWETLVFFGATGIFLAVLGAVRTARAARGFAIAMTAILTVLALGAYTPLLRWLYESVPGFDRFRATAKFMYLVSLFLAMLAAMGAHELLRSPKLARPWIWSVGAAAVLFSAAGIALRSTAVSGVPDNWWARAIARLHEIARARHDTFLEPALLGDASFLRSAAEHASSSLLLAAATLAVLAALLAGARRTEKLALAVLALAAIEVAAFARTTRPTFRPTSHALVTTESIERGSDERILDPAGRNEALSSGALDLWGYDPGVTRRHAELMAMTQGVPAERVSQYLTFTRYHPLFKMLRCGHFYLVEQASLREYNLRGLLPRALLVTDFKVVEDIGERLAELDSPSFDPQRTVLLESLPEPRPVLSESPGSVSIVNSTTDSLTIEADLAMPAILLVTDAYSEGWRARGLLGSSQKEYEVLPANHALRAVPLGAGHHEIQLEYMPASFVRGRWISIAGAVVFIALAAWTCLRGARARTAK